MVALKRIALGILAFWAPNCTGNVPTPSPPQQPAPAEDKVDTVVSRQKDAVLESASSARTKLSYHDLYFLQNETWTAGAATPLGTIFVIKPGPDKDCSSGAPRTLQETEHFVSATLDNPGQPEKLKTILIDHSTAAEISILSYVSGGFGADDVLSLTMTTQPRGVMRDSKWALELQKLKVQNPQLWTENCLVGIVTNMTKRTLTYRKYSKLTGEGTAGAYGVKVGGKYYTSDLDEEVSYVFGLNLVPLDRPAPPRPATSADELQPAAEVAEQLLHSVKEVRLLQYRVEK